MSRHTETNVAKISVVSSFHYICDQCYFSFGFLCTMGNFGVVFANITRKSQQLSYVLLRDPALNLQMSCSIQTWNEELALFSSFFTFSCFSLEEPGRSFFEMWAPESVGPHSTEQFEHSSIRDMIIAKKMCNSTCRLHVCCGCKISFHCH